MAKQAPLTSELLIAICEIIADTNNGLSGSEIGNLLKEANISDIDPSNKKSKRLYNAFANWQNDNQCSNHIFVFILKSMAPVRYMGNKQTFEWRREELNKRLIFAGLKIFENGSIKIIPKAETINEAEKRASQLKQKLSERDVHPDVINFCKAELLADNYFHAVFETTKSVADKLRSISGSSADGNDLIDSLFAVNNPVLIINDFNSETHKSEHKGFANLLRGLFGMFRNTLAHSPKVHWEMKELDALDIMSLASLCHRRLESARKLRSV